MRLNIDIANRKALPITDFEFLSLFKKEGERTFFRFVQEEKHIGKKDDCLLSLGDDSEFPLMQIMFKEYQKQGYGIYFVVNSGGQKKISIKKLTAHYIDMDFGKIPMIHDGDIVKTPDGKTIYEYRSKDEIENYKIDFLVRLETFTLNPNVVVETKNGFHIYWLLDNQKPQKLDIFTPLQEKIVEHFARSEERSEHADASVKDLSRVMRVINYNHLKDPNDPFKIKCIYLNTDVRYSQEEIADAIGCNLDGLVSLTKNSISTSSPDGISKTCKATKKFDSISSSSALSYEELKYFLKQQDLISYLGIEATPNINFCCIFHDDKKPSAVIKNDRGLYKYFCNSSNCSCNKDGKGIDIIDIVKIKNNCDTSTATKYLIQCFGLNVVDRMWINMQNRNYEDNIARLDHLGIMKDEFPNLRRILRHGYPILYDILYIGKENITNRFFGFNNESIFFFSNRYLAIKTKKNINNLNKYINLFCTLGLLNKIPYKNVNINLRKKAMQLSKENSQNGISFYTIPDYTKAFDMAEERAKVMIEFRFTIKGMSKKYLENCFGIEFANKIYHVNIADSVHKTDIRYAIEHFIMDKIESYGYCTKDMLIGYKLIVNNQYISKGEKDYEFRRVLPDILLKYDLIYVKANRKINQALGIDTMKYVIIQKVLLTN